MTSYTLLDIFRDFMLNFEDPRRKVYRVQNLESQRKKSQQMFETLNYIAKKNMIFLVIIIVDSNL